jgi:hypothetical protein
VEFTVYSKRYGNQIVEVDDEDYDIVKEHTWFVSYGGCSVNATKKLRIRGEIVVDGLRKAVYLHNLIVPFDRVRHIDGNYLNNKKNNLIAYGRRTLEKPTTRREKKAYTSEEWAEKLAEIQRKYKEKVEKETLGRSVKYCKSVFDVDKKVWVSVDENTRY